MTATLLKHRPSQKLLYHKASLLFPLLMGAEFNALVEDIKTQGLLYPIVLCDGRILEGRNRYRACRRADKAPRYETFTGDDPYAYVISANIMRRHLTRKQLRDVIASEIKRRPELSDRAIAKVAKVSHHTVASVRGETERRGQSAHVEFKKDSLGRMQPTRRKRGPSKKRTVVPNEGCNHHGGQAMSCTIRTVAAVRCRGSNEEIARDVGAGLRTICGMQTQRTR